MNFTVTSQGKQYDRLALMYFGDTEVWRTSTAEPTTNGIEWTYIKDMTEFMSLWNSPQKLIFDLGNLVNNIYTGTYNTTLTATFFTSQDTVEPASLIIPISTRSGSDNVGSVFTLPSQNATNTVSFPRNANRAVFSVYACGQADEEFWWSNVLQSDVDTFEAVDGTLFGYSPFREIQVLIDGQLAGVQWPFPVIFTGGVVPGLWRPIVGLDAFDLREHEIDITPWLPVLCNGVEHTFEIKVVGVLDDGSSGGTLSETVGSSWYVTGKVFIWLDDDASSITTGTSPTAHFPAPVITISQELGQNSTGANETLEYTTNVQRSLSVSSSVTTQSGTFTSIWTQILSTTNYGLYTDFGAVQQNNQSTNGIDQSTGGTYYKSIYSYPLYANTTYIVQPSGNFTIQATVIRGLDLSIQGTPVFPSGLQPFADIPGSASLVSGFSGSQLSTTQNGSAFYFGDPNAGVSSGFGSTSQEFSFAGLDANGNTVDTELYYRSVEAVNSTIIKDYESLVGEEMGSYTFPVANVPATETVMGVLSPKQATGRGPGTANRPLIQGSGRD
jgi:Peptide N-acetyl-beta-D-glucosaminyl asparaginase amidase A